MSFAVPSYTLFGETKEDDEIQQPEELGDDLDEKTRTDDDCISRQAVLDLAEKGVLVSNGNYKSVCKEINELPSVRPKERTGHWIAVYQGDEIINYRCTECEFGNTFGKNTDGMCYCPRCGARMKGEKE